MGEEKFMILAIEKARQGIRKGQAPFGACIVKNSKVISCSHNSVWQDREITAHAEINTIRQACKKLARIDLSGCVLYSTCEPCPMCFSACHWSKISRIVYGTRIRDAQRFGFHELAISNKKMKEIGKSRIKIKAGFLKEESLRLFKEWSRRCDKKVY